MRRRARTRPSTSRWTVSVCRPRQRGARGYDGGKKIKGRKRHTVVDSQGSVLGVWVSPADMSDAVGACSVGGCVASVSVGADSDCGRGICKEGLLEWLLSEFCVALDCVWCEGKGFAVLARRWVAARSFAWLLGRRYADWKRWKISCSRSASVGRATVVVARRGRQPRWRTLPTIRPQAGDDIANGSMEFHQLPNGE